MSRTVFYCRCGARLEGSTARLYHRCQQTAPPSDTPEEGRDLDAENDPSVLDLETFCASCGMPHSTPGAKRDCPCARHIDGPGETSCNAARIGTTQTLKCDSHSNSQGTDR
jgi:hypothetical protein